MQKRNVKTDTHQPKAHSSRIFLDMTVKGNKILINWPSDNIQKNRLSFATNTFTIAHNRIIDRANNTVTAMKVALNTCDINKISHSFIHSFILDTSIVPLQVHYYSEALPTQCGYCVVVGDRTKWYWTKWYGQNVSNFY